MGKQPVKMKAVVYALSPFQQKIMSGLWKDLPTKITHKISENWISATLLLTPLVGTYTLLVMCMVMNLLVVSFFCFLRIGYVTTIRGTHWRRGNANNVDLNRDFPDQAAVVGGLGAEVMVEEGEEEEVVEEVVIGGDGIPNQLKLAAMTIDLNVRLRSTDMPLAMQERAIRRARALVDANNPGITKPTQVAMCLKKEFDALYGPAWHCIVGKSFGSFVTHASGGFLYFSVDKLCFLLFKTEVLVFVGCMVQD